MAITLFRRGRTASRTPCPAQEHRLVFGCDERREAAIAELHVEIGSTPNREVDAIFTRRELGSRSDSNPGSFPRLFTEAMPEWVQVLGAGRRHFGSCSTLSNRWTSPVLPEWR